MRRKLLWSCATLILLLGAACSSLKTPPPPTLSPQVILGQRVFESYCSRCHSTNEGSIVVGPSLAGIATRASSRMEDMDAEMYIRHSILNPSEYTVEGFPEGAMPSSLKDDLSEEDLDAVVTYLLTLN